MGEEDRTPFGISTTKRSVSDGGENQLFREYTVGGHATIELVDYMGSDDTVERVATAGHGRGIFPENPEQKSFLMYLAGKGIHEPFTSVQLKFSFQAPIRTALTFVYEPSASVNEYSARYSVMIDSSHTPNVARIAGQLGGDLKPAEAMEKAREIQEIFMEQREGAYRDYQELIEIDMARELARTGLGIDNDTRFYWKIDLLSLANFVKKQKSLLDSGTLARDCLEKVVEIAKDVAPQAWFGLMNNNYGARLTMPTDDEIVDPPLSPAGWEPRETRRTTVPELEEIMFKRETMLDHGELQVVDYMGDDGAFAQAARTSYGKGTKTLQDDRALIKSLMRDDHTTPIEMGELAVESKTPVFVDPRQAGRHRTLDNHGFMGIAPIGSQFYIQPEDEFKYQDRINRQGRGKEMEDEDREKALPIVKGRFETQIEVVKRLRDLGAPEGDLVRDVKGVGFFTKRWRTGDTHNWNHYLMLRNHSHAQKEIRDQAKLVDLAHKLHTPTANEALHTYTMNAMKLSEKDIKIIQNLMSSERLNKDLDLDDMATYEGAGFVIKKKDKDGKVVMKNGKPVRVLGREGLAFRGKLEIFLGR